MDLPINYFEKIIAMKWEYIRDNFPLIGEGSGRLVYLIDENFVLKVGKGKYGYSQSRTEYNIYNNSNENFKKYLCPVYVFKNNRSIMLRTKPLIDIVKNENLRISDVFHMKNKESFYKDISNLIRSNDLLYDDIMAVSSWGLIKMKKPYLIDYGCTNRLYDKYFL